MALNANASLKLDTIMRTALRSLKKRLSPVLALSTVMRNQVLTETDTVQVPFYALEQLASRNFDGSYNFDGADGGPSSTRPIVINKRKYQPLEFTSKELRRNTAVDLNLVMALKVEKLAEDVLNDITSIINLATYGAAVFNGTASQFDINDIFDIRTAAGEAHWPMAGRALVLETAYEGQVSKDFAAINTVAGDQVRREGSVGRAAGFDIFDQPGMPGNGESLVGYACLPFALLTAFSPIEPADEVKDNLSDYRIYSDATTGLSLEYRSWGDPNSDKAKRLVEVNYGYAKGDAAQLLRLTNV